MNPQERKQLITDWIAGTDDPDHSEEHKAHLRADKSLNALMPYPPEDEDDPVGNPEEAWAIILELSAQPMPGKRFALLAAGPLEDFLVRYGETFIVRVEEEAEHNPRFNELLGGVWQNQMGNALWERVQAARHEVW